MAELVNAQGAQVKVRDPLAPTLLPLVTFGIYSIVWYYKVNKELKDYGRAVGDRELADSNPVNSVLAITLGAVVLIPAIISFINFIGRLQAAERHAGREQISWGVVGIILVASFFTLGLAGFALPYVEQQHLNGIWDKYPRLEPAVAPSGLPSA